MDPEIIMPWCEHNGVSGSYKEAVMDPRVADMVLKDIESIGKKDKVASFKIPKDIIIEVCLERWLCPDSELRLQPSALMAAFAPLHRLFQIPFFPLPARHRTKSMIWPRASLWRMIA